MKKIILIGIITFLFAVSGSAQNSENFVSLFNGKDLTNWTLTKPCGFEIVDGEMTDVAKPCGFEVVDGELITRLQWGSDIFSNKWYGNYILRLEFMVSEWGNSGVFVRWKRNEPRTGFEVQLEAPWTPPDDDFHCTGSIYGHVAVTDRPDETPGIWHKMEIKCDRNNITISVDGKVATMANIDSVKTMRNKPYFGAIGFQGNHSDSTGKFEKFRNIYIRDLDDEPEYVIKGFYDNNGQLRNLAIMAAVNLGEKMVQPLTELMAGDNQMAKEGAKQALFDIVAKASDPKGPEEGKKEIRAALTNSIKSTSSEITVNYLKWLSGLINK